MTFRPSSLTDLAGHLETKARLSDALAADHEANGELKECLRMRKRAENARMYAWQCLAAVRALGRIVDPLALDEEAAALEVGKLFGRKKGSKWSDGEIKAFRRLHKAGTLTADNLATLSAYYARERQKGDSGVHRRDLGTFLNNFTGELDRALTARPKSAGAQASVEDPPRWRQFCAEKCPRYVAYAQALSTWHEEFVKWEAEQ